LIFNDLSIKAVHFPLISCTNIVYYFIPPNKFLYFLKIFFFALCLNRLTGGCNMYKVYTGNERAGGYLPCLCLCLRRHNLNRSGNGEGGHVERSGRGEGYGGGGTAEAVTFTAGQWGDTWGLREKLKNSTGANQKRPPPPQKKITFVSRAASSNRYIAPTLKPFDKICIFTLKYFAFVLKQLL
jgi:hypothetical protein